MACGVLAIILLTALAYLPVLRADFLYIWDDGEYVKNNVLLRTGEGLRRIWLEPRATPQYYPLVHTSFWVEYQIWGLDPTGYHLVNVGLHIVNSLLLWGVLSALAVPGAWVAAAIFALHPVHVESVAWITERKNLLSGAFYLGAMLSLVRFTGWPAYAAGAILFVGALLSKSVTLTLPVALLVLLWWKRERIRAVELAPLLPLLVAGAAMGLVTATLEKHHVGAQGTDWGFSFVERILIAGRAFWFYLGKIFVPANLTFIYPRWLIDAHSWWQYLFPVAAALLLTALWAGRRRVGKGPLAAAVLYLVTISPALGFIDFYPMRYSFVADHFQYLASAAPIALAVALCARLLAGKLPAAPAFVLSGAILVVLATLSWRQSGYYRDQEALALQNIRENPRSWVAYAALGQVLLDKRQIDAALEQAILAVKFNPGDPAGLNLLGTVLSRKQRYEEALWYFREALRFDSDNLAAMNNITFVSAMRDYDLARRDRRVGR